MGTGCDSVKMGGDGGDEREKASCDVWMMRAFVGFSFPFF